jgi:hypothetical protein
MFPGWTAQQLFEVVPTTGDPEPPSPTSGPMVCDRPQVTTTQPSPPPAVVAPAAQTTTPTATAVSVAPVASSGSGSGMNYRAQEDCDPQVTESRNQWLITRRLLNQNRINLTRWATQLYPEEMRLGNTGLLMHPDWRLEEPVDLSSLTLDWKDTPQPPVNGRHQETRNLRPLLEPGQPYSRYVARRSR